MAKATAVASLGVRGVAMGRIGVFLSMLALSAATGRGAQGSTIAIDYLASPWGSGVTTPDFWGWNSSRVGTSGAPLLNALGLGVHAWRIDDLSPALPNVNYSATLSGPTLATAQQQGWRYATLARFAGDFGSTASMGLSVHLQNRAYHLMLDFTPSGDLQATLADESAKTFVLTSGKVGALSFHRFELASIPGSNQVQFIYDGRVMNPSTAWDGVSINHQNTIHWGNSDQARSAIGTMDFRHVEFRVGPFDEAPGDYTGDGVTDGGDLLAWQQQLGRWALSDVDSNRNGVIDAGDLSTWKTNFGATSRPSSTAAPEPGARALAIVALAFARALSRRRPSQSGRMDSRPREPIEIERAE